MTNDLTTIEGSLQEVIDNLESQLQSKGVNASFNSATGVQGLISQISNIQQSGGGTTSLPTTLTVTGNDDGYKITLNCSLKTNYANNNITINSALYNATLTIKENGNVINSAIMPRYISQPNQTQNVIVNINNVSYGKHTYVVEFDGTNTIFDSITQSVTVIADHNYELMFENEQYDIVGNNVQIKCTLKDRGVALQGETIVITNSNNSSTSLTTDSNGVVSMTISNEDTLTAIWGELSSTCNVIKWSLYDTCDTSSNISSYTAINSTPTLSIQSNDYYKSSSTASASTVTGFKSNSTFGKDVIIDIDFKMYSSTQNFSVGLYDFTLGDGYRTYIYGSSSSDSMRIIKGAYTSISGTTIGSSQSISSISSSYWYNIQMTIEDNSITTSLYKYSSDKSTKTLQKSYTTTGTLNMGDSNNLVFQTQNQRYIYIDNIKVKEL